ncbi:endonuclease domain-containing protein [Novosphingobium lentum]|uniref:endonuclease domain-containing protein n=1 Tax=Novosphingobium lentum TaxID=145287 RepID=UPI000A012A65
MIRPAKPGKTVRRAKALRRAMSLPEVLLWRELRAAPDGLRFRKQHPAGDYIIDFFCARANLAIEIDGLAHDMGDRPLRDSARDAWLGERRIETVRFAAADVLRDPNAAATAVLALAKRRLEEFGKAPPSALRAATSPSQVDGEKHATASSASTCDGGGSASAYGGAGTTS